MVKTTDIWNKDKETTPTMNNKLMSDSVFSKTIFY